MTTTTNSGLKVKWVSFGAACESAAALPRKHGASFTLMAPHEKPRASIPLTDATPCRVWHVARVWGALGTMHVSIDNIYI